MRPDRIGNLQFSMLAARDERRSELRVLLHRTRHPRSPPARELELDVHRDIDISRASLRIRAKHFCGEARKISNHVERVASQIHRSAAAKAPIEANIIFRNRNREISFDAPETA